MSAETAPSEDDTVLAGEYALGLLDAAERRAFELRLGGEPALRRLVAEWHSGLVTLTDAIAPVAPPAQLAAQIERRLFPAPRTGKVLATLVAAAAGRCRRCGGGAGGGDHRAALIAPPPSPQFGATIASADSGLVVLASLDSASGKLTVERRSGAPATGRSLELWVIPAGAQVPLSLGVIDEARDHRAASADLAAAIRDGTLAVSDEPQGGSPDGKPGKVLAAGPVTRL